MDRLADEVLQIIFNEIDNPSSFVVVCKRFYSFSQDPYVRAHYFLSRYGSVHALYWALGRGRLITGQVLDVLLSSGAHLSRYLFQIAVHHYFRSYCPFIKTAWVRTLSLSTFAHFMTQAEERFGDINTAKGEDDGAVFRNFIRESRRHTDRRGLSTDAIVEMLEKGKFIPFCIKDPIMAQFPLALSIEPRLLSLAVANGFRMDSRYRDFVFRRIFLRTDEHGVEDVLLNVRELCRLDASMFVSRTVAAEVLMEAELNRAGYAALKTLDREGGLRFSLASLVEDLIKSFVRINLITTTSVGSSLSYLWKDFPSRHPVAQLAMLLTIFIGCPKATADTLHLSLERLNLTPVSSKLIAHVLLNPFVEHFSSILHYARVYCDIGDDMTFYSFLADVAVRCLEVSTKGNMLRSMCEDYPSLLDDIQSAAATKYRLTIDNLPSPEQSKERPFFPSKLCRILYTFGPEAAVAVPEFEEEVDSSLLHGDEMGTRTSEGAISAESFLGDIGQDTLTQVVSRDELVPQRKRPWMLGIRIRTAPFRGPSAADLLHVGIWIRNQFGRKHLVTATFMNHAVVNENHTILDHYLPESGAPVVPVTLHHFKMLAHLGRAPAYQLFQAIKNGAGFFFSDNDYLKHPDIEVKRETPCAETMSSGAVKESSSIELTSSSSSVMLSAATPTRKRLHRSAAATVKSYAYAQSDSDDGFPSLGPTSDSYQPTRTVESNLQLWIRHLSALQKDETKKFNEKKRHREQSNLSGSKPRVVRSDFLKTLAINLRDLRQLESDMKVHAHIPAVPDESSGSDDDEYRCPKRPSKRRKILS